MKLHALLALTLASSALVGACGAGAASKSASGLRPVVPDDLGAPLATVLPIEPPSDRQCLGFAPKGGGALVVAPRTERGADGTLVTTLRVEFVMLTDTHGFFEVPTAPLDLPGSDLPVDDAAAWTAWRDEVEPSLVALGLRPCDQVLADLKDSDFPFVVPDGDDGTVTFYVRWDDASAGDAAEGPHDRLGKIRLKLLTDFIEVGVIRSAAQDGGDHQWLEAVYYNRWASAAVLVIRNSDTDLVDDSTNRTVWEHQAVLTGEKRNRR